MSFPGLAPRPRAAKLAAVLWATTLSTLSCSPIDDRNVGVADDGGNAGTSGDEDLGGMSGDVASGTAMGGAPSSLVGNGGSLESGGSSGGGAPASGIGGAGGAAPGGVSCGTSGCQAAGGECQGETCVFTCDEDAEVCNLAAVECPDGVDCRIDCIDDGTCSQQIVCPASRNCQVNCEENDTCTAAIDCAGSSSCSIDCFGDDSCSIEFTVANVANDLRVTCDGDNSCSRGTIRCGAGDHICDVACGGIGACGSVIELESDNAVRSRRLRRQLQRCRSVRRGARDHLRSGALRRRLRSKRDVHRIRHLRRASGAQRLPDMTCSARRVMTAARAR